MRFLILILISFSLLTACGQVRETQEPQEDPELAARQFMLRGDYLAAAEEYLLLAGKDEGNASTYRLKATTAFIEAGNYDRAFMVLKETGVDEDDVVQNSRRTILSARLDLEFGQPEKALQQLQALNPDAVPTGLRFAYHDILARAYLAQNNFMASAQERLTAREFASTNTQQQQNYQSLWNSFQTLTDEELETLPQTAPDALRGWVDLASLYRTYRFDPKKFNFAIDSWVQRYPGHPALTAIVPDLQRKTEQYVQRPANIGLLLPLSNQFKKAATAIRDGFLAAWYFDKQGQGESNVSIYDANSLNIMEVYQQAVSDGVEYVVGPLEKEAVKTLLEQESLAVPVLALNRADNVSEQGNDKLIQFGLAPEEEARQVAEVALSDGHTLALVVTPDNNWGRRIAESFTQRWVEVGGAVLEQVHFSSDLKDYATPVKEVLNVDSSEARIAELRGKLNLRIDSRERRRQDADFIFTAALPGDARQLLPQVRFYHAGDVPIYSTSHIFTGIYDRTRDSDMNDVIFVDMPWILDTRRQLSLIQDSLNRNWAQDRSNFRRLYALGIDAYRLIPELNRLRVEQDAVLSGETGDLQLATDNIIKRKLRRARFINGQPVLSN
ncbi:MAG: penicillin-binding protein activator [Gammaproteobacteria bacterium]